MSNIQQGELPQDAFLNKYKQQGAYTDCYFIDVSRKISQSEYIECFYTSSVFKVERLILSIFLLKFSNDLEAKKLAGGEITRFSAWHVVVQTSDQLVLRDLSNRTRSWLMVTDLDGSNSVKTRLYYGSEVIPKNISTSGEPKFGFLFHVFSRFHHWYSRALLRSAFLKLSVDP